MRFELKSIHDQVIVITGVTSGIGPNLARTAARQGAKVFLVDKDEEHLQKLQDEFHSNNYDTAFAVADLTQKEQVQYATDQCLKTFNRIDSWINNPPDTIKRGECDEIFHSFINCCKTALPILMKSGGSLINISVFTNEAFSKSIQRYSKLLQRKIKLAKAPVEVSLIIPSAEILAGDILDYAVIGKPKKFYLQTNFRKYFTSGISKGVFASAMGFLIIKGLRRL